jgi:hypothetical protein
MAWLVGFPELEGLAGLVVVVGVVPILEVAEDNIVHVMSQCGSPVQKGLNAVGSAGDGAQTNQVNSAFFQLIKREIKEPFQDLVSSSGLEICHDDLLLCAEGFFNQDILRKLLVQVDLSGFGEEARQRVVFIIEVHQQGNFFLPARSRKVERR